MALHISPTNWVQVDDQQLAVHVTHEDHIKILQMPGKHVRLRDGKTIGPPNSVGKYDLRVLESLLIQSRGAARVGSDGNPLICAACKRGNGVYAECLFLEGYWRNACGNCKRKDHAIRCSTGDLDWKAGDEEEDDFKDLMKTRSGRKTRAPVKYTM